MTTISPLTGLPCPDDGSPNDPPIHFQALIDVADTQMVPHFATTGARDTAFATWVTGGGVMKDGLVCRVDGVGLMQYVLALSAWDRVPNSQDLTWPVGPLDHAETSTQFNHTGTTEVLVDTLGPITGLALKSNHAYGVLFNGRPWAGVAGVDMALRVRVGVNLSTSSTAVATKQIVQPGVGPTGVEDKSMSAFFAVQTAGTYKAGLYGIVSSGSFAVGLDARGRYELTVFDAGQYTSGLVTVTS